MAARPTYSLIMGLLLYMYVCTRPDLLYVKDKGGGDGGGGGGLTVQYDSLQGEAHPEQVP